jgi:hypothetical protein
MNTATPNQQTTAPQAFPTTIRMFPQPLPNLPSNYEQCNHTLTDGKEAVAGGSLRKGINRLVKVLERRVDRQIMTAQVRAYDTSLEKHDF